MGNNQRSEFLGRIQKSGHAKNSLFNKMAKFDSVFTHLICEEYADYVRDSSAALTICVKGMSKRGEIDWSYYLKFGNFKGLDEMVQDEIWRGEEMRRTSFEKDGVTSLNSKLYDFSINIKKRGIERAVYLDILDALNQIPSSEFHLDDIQQPAVEEETTE